MRTAGIDAARAYQVFGCGQTDAAQRIGAITTRREYDELGADLRADPRIPGSMFGNCKILGFLPTTPKASLSQDRVCRTSLPKSKRGRSRNRSAGAARQVQQTGVRQIFAVRGSGDKSARCQVSAQDLASPRKHLTSSRMRTISPRKRDHFANRRD